jgi:hypothetical protein
MSNDTPEVSDEQDSLEMFTTEQMVEQVEAALDEAHVARRVYDSETDRIKAYGLFVRCIRIADLGANDDIERAISNVAYAVSHIAKRDMRREG